MQIKILAPSYSPHYKNLPNRNETQHYD